MRILHIINSMEVGGAQRLLSDLLPELKHNGIYCDLLVIRPIEENGLIENLKNNEINIFSLNIQNLYSPKILLQLISYIKKYEIVHAHLFPTLYWCAFASHFCKTKLFYTEHSTSNKRRGKWYMRPLEKSVYTRYSKVISISEQTQNNLKEWLKAKEDDKRFITINNGVNLDSFKCCMQNRNPNKNIIMISRFVASKSQATLIRAMQYVDESWNLILVGDGEKKSECEKLVTELNLNNRIQFLGTRSDIPELISKARIGVQCSNWEGFGLTAVEMMAGGLPVIASDVDGLREVVEGAGIVVENDEQEISKVVNSLIENEQVYKTIVEKCVERAKEFSIQKMAVKYLEQY